MDVILCDWCLHKAGVEETRHVCLYSAAAVTPERRREYLDEAYAVGRDLWAGVAADQ